MPFNQTEHRRERLDVALPRLNVMSAAIMLAAVAAGLAGMRAAGHWAPLFLMARINAACNY